MGPLPDFADKNWRAHLTQKAVYRHELGRILEAMDERAIEVAVLKGAPLAKSLFGDSRLRRSGDIDLLVDPERVETAVSTLESLGYRASRDEAGPWGSNQKTMRHQSHQSVVDLHWRVAPPYVSVPATSRWLENRRMRPIDGVRAPGLRPNWECMHLCYHFHNHRWGLKHLIDIAAWLDRYGDSHPAGPIARTMASSGAVGVLQWPFATLTRLTDTDLEWRRNLPEPDWPVDVWARASARWMRRRWVELAEPSWADRQTLDGTVPGNLLLVAEKAASLMVLDDWRSRPERLLYPIVFGQHRYSRLLFEWFERIGWLEAEDYYERPVFGRYES